MSVRLKKLIGTIITVMFIESCYEEVENKLTLQQGKNSTYFFSENSTTDSRTR